MIKKKLVFENEYLSTRKKPINLDEGDKYLFHHEFKKNDKKFIRILYFEYLHKKI